jgi:hypothetical protein
MLISHYKKAGKIYNIKIPDRFIEGLAKLKYSGTIITDVNCMNLNIKCVIISRNASYHSVKRLFSSRLISRM